MMTNVRSSLALATAGSLLLACQAVPVQQTPRSGDDLFVTYNAVLDDLLRLGACSSLSTNRGDRDGAAVFGRFEKQAIQDPEMALVARSFPVALAREVEAQGRPDGKEVAAFTARNMREGAKRRLGKQLEQDLAGFQRGCDEIRARAGRGEGPFAPLDARFPATIASFRKLGG